MQTRRASASAAAAAGPLDLHEGFATDVDENWVAEARARRASIVAAGCKRWPRSLRLHAVGGRLVPGRCGGTRLCDYCGIIGGVEWSEMLALDALEGNAPTVYVCLTTSRADWTARDARLARQLLWRAIKAEWASAEYGCLVEFTTGYASSSGGRRRPHWNLLLKGVPDDPAALRILEELVRAHWCKPARAKMIGQKIKPVWAAEGLIRYLGLHFLKESQKPPSSWKGHRVSVSLGYFANGRRAARAAAQESLRLKRELWRAERSGLEGAEALAVAELELLAAEGREWTLVELEVSELGELVGIRPALGGGMPAPAPVTRRARQALEPSLADLESLDEYREAARAGAT